MRNNKQTEIKVGITVSVGIIIFIWILFWVKDYSFTSSYKNILVEFNNSSGLVVGDKVTVNGVDSGNLKEIRLQDDKVILTLNLEEDVTLKSDAKFTISMVDLMGGKKIDINPGTSAENLDITKIHKGEFLADLPTVISELGNMQNLLVETFTKINTTLNNINDNFGDGKVKNDIHLIISSLKNASSNFEEILRENKDQINKLVANTKNITDDLKNVITDNKESVHNSLNRFNILTSRADSLFLLVHSFLKEIKNKKNNLGKLLYDKTFYANLELSLSRLNELSGILIKQLKGDGINVDASIF